MDRLRIQCGRRCASRQSPRGAATAMDTMADSVAEPPNDTLRAEAVPPPAEEPVTLESLESAALEARRAGRPIVAQPVWPAAWPPPLPATPILAPAPPPPPRTPAQLAVEVQRLAAEWLRLAERAATAAGDDVTAHSLMLEAYSNAMYRLGWRY